MERRIRCPACAATWPPGTARFCGRCGERLHLASAPHLPADPRRSRSRALRRPIGLLAAFAVIVALAISIGVRVDVARDAASAEDGVELPDRSVEEADAAATPVSPALGESLPSFECKPVGCSLWEARIGDGAYAVAADRIVQAATLGVRALDLATGRTLWRVTYVEDGLPPLLDAVEIRLLGDEVVVTSEGGLIQVRTVETGELRWYAELPVGRVTGVAVHGDVLVAAGLPRAGELQPPVAIAVYDRRSGVPRWEADLHRAVSIDADPLVLQPRTLEVVAVDPTTGEVVWTRDVIGPVRGLVGDGALALISPGGVDVLDPRTGDRLRSVPRRVSDSGVTRFTAGLLLVDAPSGPDPHATPRSDMTIASVGDPQQPTRQIPGTTAVLEVPDGVAVASHDDHVLTVERLASDGAVRWTRTFELDEPTCCWTLQGGPDPTTLLLVPPEPGRVPVQVLTLDEGQPLVSFAVPTTQVRNTLAWTGGIAAESDANRTVLTGHGGSVELAAGAELVATDPVPVVRVPSGLLGLDRDGLLPLLESR
jgi:hypothetical protein